MLRATAWSRSTSLSARILISSLVASISLPALAQTYEDGQEAIEITEPSSAPRYPNPSYNPPARGARPGFQPKVGRRAAQKYMNPDAPRSTASESGSSYSGGGSRGTHYLALHLGGYFANSSYKWGGKDRQDNVGKYTVGVTYRVGEWVNSMDLGIRVDVNGYSLQEGRATKLSFLPVITFPDSESKFPLYFGIGAGPGIFLNQISDESSIALDYQLFGGVRFFDVIENTGFFIEAGLKNHLLLTSDGQFNGTFAAVGALFTF